jgi:hypothetical protein
MAPETSATARMICAADRAPEPAFGDTHDRRANGIGAVFPNPPACIRSRSGQSHNYRPGWEK